MFSSQSPALGTLVNTHSVEQAKDHKLSLYNILKEGLAAHSSHLRTLRLREVKGLDLLHDIIAEQASNSEAQGPFSTEGGK